MNLINVFMCMVFMIMRMMLVIIVDRSRLL